MSPVSHPFRTRSRRAALALAAFSTLVAPIVVGSSGGASTVQAGERGEVTSDVELIAKQYGWNINATAQHMDVQFEFGMLINTLANKFPKQYAGAELAEKPGQTSQVMVAGKAPGELVELVKQSGLDIQIVDGKRYSEVDQQHRAAEVIKVLKAAGHEDVVTAVLPTGEMQVSVSGKGKRVRLPRHLRDNVRVAYAPGAVTVDENAMGGLQVYGPNGQCTSGFSVREISTGRTGIATAAHCTGMNRINVVGPDATMVFRGQHNGALGDMEWHTTSDTEVDNYIARPGEERDVSMVWPSNGFATNMITCVHSRMQGTRSCDRIYSTSVSSNGAGSLIAMDNDNTVGGDSGGPWSFNSIADGIHKGDKWIWFGTRNVFSKAALLPAALGVEVMT